MYKILFCKMNSYLMCTISIRGRGFIPNYRDVLKHYVLNAYTAILLCFVIFMWISVNINVNVNMLIRNSRNNGMNNVRGKNNIVSVLWIIFMFVCVIKIYFKKTLMFLDVFIFFLKPFSCTFTLNSFVGHFMLHKHNAAGSLICQHSNPLTPHINTVQPTL